MRVCWQGTFYASTSLAIVNRRLVAALHARGNLAVALASDPFAKTKLALEYRPFAELNAFSAADAEVTVNHRWPPQFAAPARSRYAHMQLWEYGSMPIAWFDALHDDCDELWVPSAANARAYRDAGFPSERLALIPLGVDTHVFSGSKPHLEGDRFTFLFVGGTIFRKGIDLLVDAYVRAFRGHRDVVLTIKDVNASSVYRGHNSGDQLRELSRRPDLPPIAYVDATFSDADLAALMRDADCFVLPYRGEAFALPVLEAMACGLPVIVTAGGATDDFVDETVGWRVPAQRRELAEDEVPLPTRSAAWLLEPDVAALAERMRYAYENRDQARHRGEAGARRAREWSWDRAAAAVEERVTAIAQRPARSAGRRDAAYRDASRYAERILGKGQLDGIVLELFNRLGVAEPSFFELGDAPARILGEGLGWRRASSADTPVDMLWLEAGDVSLAQRPRAIARSAGQRPPEGYTCIAVERTRADALFVRDDLLERSGFTAFAGAYTSSALT